MDLSFDLQVLESCDDDLMAIDEPSEDDAVETPPVGGDAKDGSSSRASSDEAGDE